MNNENLITQRSRSHEERVRIARAGGIASGEARRKRKQLKDELITLLSDGDVQKAMCIALIDRAKKGDYKAFATVRDTIGESPEQHIHADVVGKRQFDWDMMTETQREAVGQMLLSDDPEVRAMVEGSVGVEFKQKLLSALITRDESDGVVDV